MLDFFGTEISIKKIVNSLLYLAVVFVIYLILRRILKIFFNRGGGKKTSAAQRQRIKTVTQMLSSVLKYLMLIIVLLVVLADLGVNVSSLLAGLGILTAVLGLAFQDMIKDFIAGIAIIAEDQFGVGDVVELNGFQGTVLSVGLKTTEIKNANGQVMITANHNIDGLINYSKFNATAVVEVKLSYEVDGDKVMAALNEVKRKIARTTKLSASEISITPAAADLDAEGVSYKMFCPCSASDCSDVQSMMREMILNEFKKQNIKIPYQQIIVKDK